MCEQKAANVPRWSKYHLRYRELRFICSCLKLFYIHRPLLLLFTELCPSLCNPHWTAALSFTVSWSLLKLMSIESMIPSNISPCVSPFSCPQSFPAPRSVPMSQLFISDGQSTGASASVLPMNILKFRIDFL